MSIYKIQRVKQIGAGGFSIVYEANISGLGRVALKELVSRLPDDIVRFCREVQYQSELRHPNIVPVLAYELDTNPLWFAMPLAPTNLDREISRVKADRPLVHSIFRQILAGVAHAHQYHVIHRDLKPENILIYEGDACQNLAEDTVYQRTIRFHAADLSIQIRRRERHCKPERIRI